MGDQLEGFSDAAPAEAVTPARVQPGDGMPGPFAVGRRRPLRRRAPRPTTSPLPCGESLRRCLGDPRVSAASAEVGCGPDSQCLDQDGISLADQLDADSLYYGMIVPAYQASKAALNLVTIGLSKSLADTPIKVNSICPGFVQTDLGGPETRAQAPLTAEQAADIVVEMATVGEDAPTGSLSEAAGTVPW